MGFELKGFDELEKTLEALGDIGRTISNKALKEGSKIVLAEQKKLAPQNSKSDKHGVDQLTTSTIKKYKNGNAYIRVGIVGGNWEDCRGIYFQNFNGIHSSGKNVGWINKSFENSKDEATSRMKSILQAEVKKLL